MALLRLGAMAGWLGGEELTRLRLGGSAGVFERCVLGVGLVALVRAKSLVLCGGSMATNWRWIYRGTRVGPTAGALDHENGIFFWVHGNGDFHRPKTACGEASPR